MQTVQHQLAMLAETWQEAYPNPTLRNQTITTDKLADNSVADNKIVSVSGIKVTGNITGNAGNVTGVVDVVHGGTGATTAAAAKENLGLGNVDNTRDVNKPISLAVQSALDIKLNAADTAIMLAPYRNMGTIQDAVANKLNITDTAAMLAPYANAAVVNGSIANKVNIADTANDACTVCNCCKHNVRFEFKSEHC